AREVFEEVADLVDQHPLKVGHIVGHLDEPALVAGLRIAPSPAGGNDPLVEDNPMIGPTRRGRGSGMQASHRNISLTVPVEYVGHLDAGGALPDFGGLVTESCPERSILGVTRTEQAPHHPGGLVPELRSSVLA